MPCLIVSCFVMFGWLLSLGGLLFSERKWRGSGSRGEVDGVGELGKVEGETVLGMYGTGEESIFNENTNKKQQVI